MGNERNKMLGSPVLLINSLYPVIKGKGASGEVPKVSSQ